MSKLTDGRQEFRNNTKGFIGVTQYAPNGDEKGLAVAPGETVWLNEAEVEITSRAPKNKKDSPFAEQQVPTIDPETGEVLGYEPITPLTLNTEDRPNPLKAERGVEAEGSHDADEEVGAPKAQSAAAKKRRRAPAAKA